MNSAEVFIHFSESRKSMVVGQMGLLFTHVLALTDPRHRLRPLVNKLNALQRALSDAEIAQLKAPRDWPWRTSIRLKWLTYSLKRTKARLQHIIGELIQTHAPERITLRHGLNGETPVAIRFQHEAIALYSLYLEGEHVAYR